mmetsp:Transcript_18735/g.37542  ORF Transcript_18735/g.37542 Transcript_18735/m.37542 type:complete len:200 (-) Transcript_18735:262-861(-)
MLGHAHFESHLTLLMMGRGQAWSKSAVTLLSTSSVASSYLSGVSCSRSKVNVCCPHSQNAFVFPSFFSPYTFFLSRHICPCTVQNVEASLRQLKAAVDGADSGGLFRGLRQRDAYEFVGFFVDSLHEELVAANLLATTEQEEDAGRVPQRTLPTDEYFRIDLNVRIRKLQSWVPFSAEITKLGPLPGSPWESGTLSLST